MRQTDNAERIPGWIVDYSTARAKAIAWLGDRYLLARPINRTSSAARVPAGQRPALSTERS